MVWMQNLMRRRQSQSPPESSSRSFFGSKNKRRSLRRASADPNAEYSYSATSGSDDAPWRVENIRGSPPTADEWWHEDTSMESSFEQSEDDDTSSGTEERLETFLAKSKSMNSSSLKFYNCGLATWLKARSEWNKRTVKELPPRPTPAEYNQLARGLKKHSTLRTYELPRQMTLSDLVDVYTDIWDGEV